MAIDDYSFSRLKLLQKLDLSGNKLETLNPNTFFDTFEKSAESVLKVLYLYGILFFIFLKSSLKSPLFLHR